MIRRRTHREIKCDGQRHFSSMAEGGADPKAAAWFRRPAYQATGLAGAEGMGTFVPRVKGTMRAKQ